MKEMLSGILVILGTIFMLVAGIGILRMPDLYTRMSATTKVTTLGIGSILVAAAIYFQELSIVARALATIAFMLLTTPVAAHAIGRASYLIGVPLCPQTVRDELYGRYDPQTHLLESAPLYELKLQLTNLHIERLKIPDRASISGKNLEELQIRQQYGVTVLAICRGTHVIPNPDGDVQLFSGDELIVIGTPEQVKVLRGHLLTTEQANLSHDQAK